MMKDSEYRAIQRLARSRDMSIAEWVRQALASALREPTGSMGKKLESIRLAAQHEFPALAEIEAGYGSGARP